MPEVAEKQTPKMTREQQNHEIEQRAARVEINSNIAYTLKNCLILEDSEESEAWKGGEAVSWNKEQLEQLKNKLYNTLMGL